jgi:hypothetical protein
MHISLGQIQPVPVHSGVLYTGNRKNRKRKQEKTGNIESKKVKYTLQKEQKLSKKKMHQE